MRIPQWEPELSTGKTLARHLHRQGMRPIPDLSTIECYEDKLLQSLVYREWMPKTHVLKRERNTVYDVERAVADLGLPFISKSREGSSSVNVRLVKTLAEAQAEWAAVMEGTGLPVKIGKGRQRRQIGYLIWQKFCQGNDYDYRVCINGRKLCMLQRDNAHGMPFASGSGKNRPVNDLTPESRAVLDKAVEFFSALDLKWCGIDLVHDNDEKDWKVLETTLGWSLSAYRDCHYFGTEWRGADIWRVLVEEIGSGVFK